MQVWVQTTPYLTHYWTSEGILIRSQEASLVSEDVWSILMG
jgi:hypothetical protein